MNFLIFPSETICFHIFIDKTLITRMFDVKDKEEIPSKFENGENFWNLLYQLPKQTLVN